MKTSNMKKVLSLVLGVVLLLTALFVMSSCKKEEHVHTLGDEITMTAATCTSDGVAKRVCSECDYYEVSQIKATGHDLVTHDGKDATCTTDGYEDYVTCSKCDYTTFSVDSIIEEKGHKWQSATCIAPATCKTCGETTGDVLEHTPAVKVTENKVKPTCTEDGSHDEVVYCSNKNCMVELSRTTIVDPATGHNNKHTAAKEPTCTIGWDAYTVCSTCGYSTYNEKAPIYEHISASETSMIVTKEATCTTEGSYYMVKLCTTCGEYEMPGTKSEDHVIEALGHTYVNYPGKNPTCTEDGWKAYHTCTRCGDTNYETIPALGHDWSTATCTEPSCCNRCGEYSANPLGHTPVVTQVNLVDPTCTTAGSYKNVHTCSTCGTELKTELVDIAPLGHVLEGHSPKAQTCTEVGWHHFETCIRCDYSTYAQNEIPANGHTGLPATQEYYVSPKCTVDGHYDSVVYCSVCSAQVSRDVVTIPATGHSEYTYNSYNAYATCTTDGNYDTVTKCSVCHTELGRVNHVVSAHGHNIINVAAQEPDCDDYGWYDYSYCNICYGENTIVVIPALGHTGIEVHPGQTATCTQDGWNEYETCSTCNYSNFDEMVIPAPGHDIVTVPAQAPTCTEGGWNAYTECSVCGGECTKDQNLLPVIPHSYTAVVTAPTCVADGYTTYTCGCGDAYVVAGDAAIGHNFSESNGYCQNNCGDRISIGLAYSNNPDGLTCVVSGIGNCTDTEIIIPDVINGRKVVGIAYEAFYRNKNITKVVIGNNVETIEAFAFSSCSNLTQVVIGSGVKLIENSAFRDCNKLSSVGYVGTAAQWNGITIKTVGNDYLKNATRYYI